MKWPFAKPENIRKLEEEVRQERGRYAVNIVNLERADNALDKLVKQHFALLRGARDETHS